MEFEKHLSSQLNHKGNAFSGFMVAFCRGLNIQTHNAGVSGFEILYAKDKN